jgi:surface antigen
MRRFVFCLALAAAATIPSAAAGGGVVDYGYVYAARCPDAGVAERVDRWNMFMCNCTSYAAWALSANGQRTDWFIPGGMNAQNWPHVARLHSIPVGTRPRVGAVAVWEHLTPFGHVAYVTELEPGGDFDVAEYNLPGAGAESFDFDTRDDVSPSGVVFIYVPKRRR